MSNLEFVKKLYNGKNCYSDHMEPEEIQLIHISSRAEGILEGFLDKGKIVFLTGNPGDGKTFIIKAIQDCINRNNVYVQTDLNFVDDYSKVATEIVGCYQNSRAAVIAVNEYPFIQLCKEIKAASQSMYSEIQRVKKEAIIYDTSTPLTGRIAIIDLNERNILGTDYDLLSELIDRMIAILDADAEHIPDLRYNLNALSNKHIKSQLLALLQLASAGCEHFAVRDILGALSFIFTACTMEDYKEYRYYSAIFAGSNDLLKILQQFDPVFLSVPSLDEKLWNGEVLDGWTFGVPEKTPKDYEDVDEALECFKNIKRRYYFENSGGKDLLKLQPSEVSKSTEIFAAFETQKKKIKESIIKSINKLFLPASDDRKQLHIWTTHRYDMSQDASVAVSSKSVDASDLEILMPRPADWLKGLEYIPDHIILKPKGAEEPTLTLDVDFLRTLNAVDNGYPVGLLAPQYEQAAAMFLKRLDDEGFSESNDDGEVIIASRKKSFTKTIHIQNGKYDFEGED